MRKYKERAVKYFAVFLLFMLVCTIVSRGIYAWQMPKVVTETVETHTLTRKILADGVVLTKEEAPVVVEAGILVEKVCVVEGQSFTSYNFSQSWRSWICISLTADTNPPHKTDFH